MSSICHLICVACAVGVLPLMGCGKKDSRPGRVRVSGTVLRAGQPVADAAVIFEPLESTPAATGTTDASGRFTLTTFDTNDGAVPGEYKVALHKIEMIRSERPADAPDDLATPPPQEKWLLPMKYGSTSTSGLTASVKVEAKNDFKFELTE